MMNTTNNTPQWPGPDPFKVPKDSPQCGFGREKCIQGERAYRTVEL